MPVTKHEAVNKQVACVTAGTDKISKEYSVQNEMGWACSAYE